jgi:hypothetical protein
MSTTLDNLAAYVATIQADQRFIDTSRKQSAALNKFMSKKATRGGALLNLSIKNGSQVANGKFFLPDDTSDYVGVTASSNVFQKLTPVVQAQFAWSFHATNLMYSDVMLQQAKTGGKSQLANYIEDRLRFSEGQTTDDIGAGIISGTGNGAQSTLATGGDGPTTSSATDPYGLNYQDRYFSGTVNGNANSPSTNTHLGAYRHLHPELISNVYDATDHYGTALEMTGATVTNGSTTVSVATNLDYAPYLGWQIWIDTANGTNYVPLGREYVVADVASGATTTFQMSQVYRGSNDSSVAIKLVPPYTTAVHGAAGAWTPAKLISAYYAAADGDNVPDLGLMNTATFAAMKNFMWNTNIRIVADADMEGKGYKNNFMFEGATCVVDNNKARGEVHFVNTDWTKLYVLEGMTDWKIRGSDIIELPSQTGHKMYGAVKVFPFQLISESPRSNARVIGLDV